MDNTHTVAFIGGGNMAYSLVRGLLQTGSHAEDTWTGEQIRVADVSAGALERFSEFGIHTSADNQEAISGADVVVLAVKPQVAKEVVSGLGLQAHQLLVSIAAGINCTSLASWTPHPVPILRCMPNTPALLGLGITGLYATTHCTDAHKALGEAILGAAGETIWVDDEALLDGVTAVSGSGPAYFFLLMEAMIEAGTQLGLDYETALKLTQHTASGAAAMVQAGAQPPAALRANVTSPGGTTAAALAVMQQKQLKEIVIEALAAAEQRATELAKEFGK